MEKNFDKNNENCIEFLNGQRIITTTFCAQKWINKVKRYAESHPDDVKIIKENADGSLYARLPAKWLKLSPPRTVNLTDEQRLARAERLRAGRVAKTIG